MAALAVLLKHRLHVLVKRDGSGRGEHYTSADGEKKRQF
jgi:hypothetical protein